MTEYNYKNDYYYTVNTHYANLDLAIDQTNYTNEANKFVTLSACFIMLFFITFPSFGWASNEIKNQAITQNKDDVKSEDIRAKLVFKSKDLSKDEKEVVAVVRKDFEKSLEGNMSITEIEKDKGMSVEAKRFLIASKYEEKEFLSSPNHLIVSKGTSGLIAKFASYNLDNKGKDEIFVTLMGHAFCGLSGYSHSCPLHIFQYEDKKWNNINRKNIREFIGYGNIGLGEESILILNHKTNGYHDFSNVLGSAKNSSYISRWNGKYYE